MPRLMAEPDIADLREAILSLVEKRGDGKSICPSEAARAVAPQDWRRLMRLVRAEAVALAMAGKVAILRKGKPVDPLDFRGVYRIGLPVGENDDGEET